MLGNIWKAHDLSPWQNNFINGNQIHNQSPWFKPMAIHSSKAQFSLAISKAQFSLATSKPNYYWQHQSPIPIGNIKAQFSLALLYQKEKSPRIRIFGNIWEVYDSSLWQNNFINGIQIHDQSSWFKPMAIYLSKAQFLLATSKPNSHWQYQKLNLRWHY